MRTYLYDDIPTEQWEIILQDKNIITDKMKMIISLLYQAPDYTLNAGAMARIMGYTSHAPLNNIVGTCGRKIKEQCKIPSSCCTV